ncbi:hypothetical protein [Candidatus Tisiphia endosymbiont of Sialis lutaria]|uniref:hypothetical protein n=1 Tax=Candidatus Tisiphia endosymbiont of Sialis lutaria TaxID=2029164 RepID=UPI00312C791C
MDVKTVLNEVIKEHCPFIHNNRLNALLDVAEGLRYSQNLSLSAIGRNLSGDSKVKHKIKKVDRCIVTNIYITRLIISIVLYHISYLSLSSILMMTVL